VEGRVGIEDWGQRTGDWGLGTEDGGLGTEDWDWGLRTEDWGLGTGYWVRLAAPERGRRQDPLVSPVGAK